VLSLQHGRTLSVDTRSEGEFVEIRDARGTLELRVRLTQDGVVLQLEGARISLKAEESIDLDCKTFNVNADSDIRIVSGTGELRVKGERVYIN
jgi:hypothetical protein